MPIRSSRSKQTHKGNPSEPKDKQLLEESFEKNKEGSLDPVSLEIDTPASDPIPAPKVTKPEQIQTDVREKLQKKSVEENIFVPANPAALEKQAEQVAKEQGFELTRGTSIGARLLARARKINP